MAVFLTAMLGCFAVIGAFAIGAVLGYHARDKAAFLREKPAAEVEKKGDENGRIPLEKQFNNLMSYGGDIGGE